MKGRHILAKMIRKIKQNDACKSLEHSKHSTNGNWDYYAVLPWCIYTSVCVNTMIDTLRIMLTYVISVNLWGKQGLWFPFQTMTSRTTRQRNKAHQLDESLPPFLGRSEGVKRIGNYSFKIPSFCNSEWKSSLVYKNLSSISHHPSPTPATTAMIDNIHWAFTMYQKLWLIFCLALCYLFLSNVL